MIDVTCAIIRNEDNEILVVQRGEKSDHPFKWEFPGGKVDAGENFEECIIREIREELSIDIIIIQQLPAVEYDYGHKQIRLIPFICDTLDDLPVLSEHADFKWKDQGNLMQTQFCEADLIVAEQYLSISGINDAVQQEKPVYNSVEDSSVSDNELQGMIMNEMGMKAVDWVASSAIENPAVFRKLLEYSYSDDRKLAFRSSWTLTKVCDKFPEIIHPHLSDIVESLPRIDNESVQRSFLRIISLSDLQRLNSRHHGILADLCFTLLRSGLSAIAVKAYSMETLFKLSLIYPELSNELASSLRLMIEDTSAGIKAKAKTILRKIS